MATAICRDDFLPGAGGFPRTDAREVGVVHALARLPYLFGDKTPPVAPGAPTANPGGSGIEVLAWPGNEEADVAGYQVYRSDTSGGPYVAVGPFLDRSTFVDTAITRDSHAYYVVRAVDTSGNASSASSELAVG